MEKSDYYYRRKELLENYDFPSISEYKTELGEDLCDAFFCHCPNALKPYIGLVPKLHGAGDDLWVSPSDLLIGKVCLKPPLTNKSMKALTHQGILSIGYELEARQRIEVEKEIENAVADNEEILKFLAYLDKQQCVEEAHNQEQKICTEEKLLLEAQFEQRLQYELNQLAEALREEYELLLSQQKVDLDIEWQLKLEEAVAAAVTRLTEQFLHDLEEQEKNLLRDFDIERRKMNRKCALSKQVMEDHCVETFHQLTHQLKCKNIANIMYILCTERQKCQHEQQNIVEDYEKKIALLEVDISKKDIEILNLMQDRDAKIKQIDLREECLLAILRQYQKFINFALRACPTQAEFLLDVEKMMVFELTQAIAETDKKHAMRLASTLLPWKSDSADSFKKNCKTSKIDIATSNFHDCYNELDAPVKTTDTISENEYLPAFYYENQMYVREDFRNMMSKGVHVSPSNLIWNRDVEHLMEVLKSSVSDAKLQEAEKEEDIQIEEEAKLEPQRPQEKVSIQSTQVTATENKYNMLHPVISTESSITALIRYNDVAVQAVQSATSLKDPCCDHTSLEECTSRGDVVNNPSYKIHVPLIGAANSLEIAAELVKEKRKSLTSCGTRSQPDVLRLSSKNSVNKYYESKRSSVVSEANKNTGILCAIDSLDKLRKSILPMSRTKINQHLNIIPDDSTNSIEIAGMLAVRDSLHKHRMSMKATGNLLKEKVLSDLVALPPPEKKEPSTFTGRRKSILKQASPMHSNVKRHISVERLSKTAIKEYNLHADCSRLTECRDSIEVIKSRSAVSRLSMDKHIPTHSVSQVSIEIKNEMLAHDSSPLSEDTRSKSVKLSHIEIISEVKKLDKTKQHKVDHILKTKIDSPWLVYDGDASNSKEPEMTKVRLKKTSKVRVAGIVGDRNAKEHLKDQGDFTLCRINSMMDIFKKHPSLLRIFTSCTK